MGFLMMNFLFPLFHFQAYTHVSPVVYGAWDGVSYHVLFAVCSQLSRIVFTRTTFMGVLVSIKTDKRSVHSVHDAASS